MPRIRRAIRKTTDQAPAPFDEQFWPVILSLLLLGGFLSGTVAVYLRFDDPRPYASAWTWLFVIPVVGCGAIWLLRRLPRHVVRRGLQLSAVLAILVHLLIFVASLETGIFGRLWQRPDENPTRRPPRELRIVRQYDPIHLQSQRETPALLRPNETETPDPEVPDPQRTEQRPQPIREQPLPVPEPQPTPQPQVVQRPRPAESVPRQSERDARLSRQPTPTPPQPDTTVAMPANPSRPTPPSPPQPTASSTAARASSPAEPAATAPTSHASAASRDAPAAAVARATNRQAPSPSASSESAATLPRAINTPQRVPATDVPAENLAAARRTAPDQPQPNRVATLQRTTTSPTVERTTAATSAPAVSDPRATPRRTELPAERQPTLAQSPAPVPNQRTRATTRPEVATTAAPAATAVTAATASSSSATAPASSPSTAMAMRQSPAESPLVAPEQGAQSVAAVAAPSPSESSLAHSQRAAASAQPTVGAARSAGVSRSAPQASAQPQLATAMAAQPGTTPTAESSSAVMPPPSPSLARQSGASLAAGDRAGAAAAAEAAIADSAMLAASVSRAASGASADAPVSQVAAASLSRATGTATLPASSTSAPAVAAATTGTSSAVATAPPPAPAFTRSVRGVAGAGESANMDRGLAGAQSPAHVASGAARRAEATQSAPAAAALAPSSPAVARQSLAGANRPAAPRVAVTALDARVAGAAEPTDLAATAAATRERSSASVASGAVDAAAGNIEVDLGPNRLVSESGSSRAAGGGAPELNAAIAASDLPRASRQTRGAPEVSAVVAEAVASSDAGGAEPPAMNDLAPAFAAVGRGTPTAASIAEPGTTPGGNAAPGGSESMLAAGRSPERAGGGGAPAAAGDGAARARLNAAPARADQLARSESGGANGLPITDVSANVPTRPSAATGDVNNAAVAALATTDAPARGSLADAAAADAGLAAVPNSLPNAAAGDAVGAASGPAGTSVARAEATDGGAGSPALGGGTAAAARELGRATLATGQPDAAVTVAAAPSSSGRERGADAPVTDLAAGTNALGRMSPAAADTVGALAGETVIEAGQGRGDGAASVARSDLAAGAGPTVNERGSGATVGRSDAVGMNSLAGLAPNATVPLEARSAGDATGNAGGEDLVGEVAAMPGLTRQSDAALLVDLAADVGAGGLGDVESTDAGTNSRRASSDSVQLTLSPARFLRSDVGGVPDYNTGAAVATESYRRRGGRGGEGGRASVAPNAETEAAIERGLAFLARYQLPDGSWSLQSFPEPASLSSDTAATGLALLAFQGFGYTQVEGKYRQQVQQALDHLVARQQPNGDLYRAGDDQSTAAVWLYSHAIASIALCEAYGMTQDPRLREPAQQAVRFIVAAQSDKYGGWRYAPGVGSDTSVSGWMLMALKSAELAGLEVPPQTFALVNRWLDAARGGGEQGHLYRYNPYAPDTVRDSEGVRRQQAHHRDPTRQMTAVAMLMRLYGGWKRDHEAMVNGADFLRANLPSLGTAGGPRRDAYYWYYGTQVMFHMGGDYWKDWNEQLEPLLLEHQVLEGPLAGSWHPRQPVPDAWGPHAGRLYVTTMNLLNLEVYYRHLPIYEETAR